MCNDQCWPQCLATLIRTALKPGICSERFLSLGFSLAPRVLANRSMGRARGTLVASLACQASICPALYYIGKKHNRGHWLVSRRLARSVSGAVAGHASI